MIEWTVKLGKNGLYTLTFSAEGKNRVTITSLSQRELEELSYTIEVAIPAPF